MATGNQTRVYRPGGLHYQGDGDLGFDRHGEIVHAGGTRENITVIFIKQRQLRHDRRANGSHHPAGMKTTSSPNGR